MAERDFFITYASADRAWAEFIARELEATGYTILIRPLIIGPGVNFLSELQKGAEESMRTLIVLSPSFLELKLKETELTSVYGDLHRSSWTQQRRCPWRIA